MTQWLLAAALIATAAASLRRFPAFHPAQLWAVPWAIAAFAFALHLLPYQQIRLSSALLIVLSVAGFVAGTDYARRRGLVLGPPRLRLASWGGELDLERSAAVAFGLALTWCLAFVAQAVIRFGWADVISADYAVRQAIGAGDFALTIKFVYAALGSAAIAAAVAGWAPTAARRRLWLALATASVAMIYLATGRSTLIAAAVIALVAFSMSSGIRLSRRRVAIGALIAAAGALGIFVAGGALANKTFVNNTDLIRVPSAFNGDDDLPDWMALPYEYISAPIAAADVQFSYIEPVGGSWGCATLPEACAVLRSLGFGVEPIDRVRPFTARPLRWNTYTSLDVPALDFGWLLTWPVFIALGILSGALWGRAVSRGPASIALYSLLAPALITGFNVFNFTATHVIGSMIYAVAVIWVVGAFSRRRQEDVR